MAKPAPGAGMVTATIIFAVSALIFLGATVFGLVMLRKVQADFKRAKEDGDEPR